MRMLKKGEEAEIQVSWEDQSKINQFSKLTAKVDNLEEQYEEIKKEKEYLDDLSQELELCDDDEMIKYRIGDVYVNLPYSQVTEFLEKDQEKMTKELEELKSSMDSALAEMEKLKVHLYSRFGNSINLERE